jgi:hypothetical protein
MKKLIIAVVFALTGVGSVNAQVEDQLALKRLVDTFSILAEIGRASCRERV